MFGTCWPMIDILAQMKSCGGGKLGIGWLRVIAEIVKVVLLTRPMEVHHVFSGVPQFGSLRPLQKTVLGKNKTATG